MDGFNPDLPDFPDPMPPDYEQPNYPTGDYGPEDTYSEIIFSLLFIIVSCVAAIYALIMLCSKSHSSKSKSKFSSFTLTIWCILLVFDI